MRCWYAQSNHVHHNPRRFSSHARAQAERAHREWRASEARENQEYYAYLAAGVYPLHPDDYPWEAFGY